MSQLFLNRKCVSVTTRAAIASILSDDPHPAAVAHVVETSTHMARSYLRHKARLGSLKAEHFGLSIDDLAIDSSAELFQRDEDGRYVELRQYFESIHWMELDDAGVEIALRRIVFSKVSEALFRRFRENDPNLGKVIRNIKDAARSLPDVGLERIAGQLWLVFGSNERLGSEKPAAAGEVLEAHVTAALGSGGRTQDAVRAVAAFFEAHTHYRSGFPVSGLGKIVRSAYIRLGQALVEEEPSRESAYSTTEVADAIDAATAEIRRQFLTTYVERKKVDEHTFQLYVRAVRDIIELEYVHDASSNYSHFDVLASHEPSLSDREYREHHRNRIEYMVKTARARLAEFLTADLLRARTVSSHGTPVG